MTGTYEGFPSGSVVKNPPANANLASIPGWGRSPREGNGNLLLYSCLEKPMDRGAWWATVHGVTRVRHNLDTKQECMSTNEMSSSRPVTLKTALWEMTTDLHLTSIEVENILAVFQQLWNNWWCLINHLNTGKPLLAIKLGESGTILLRKTVFTLAFFVSSTHSVNTVIQALLLLICMFIFWGFRNICSCLEGYYQGHSS